MRMNATAGSRKVKFVFSQHQRHAPDLGGDTSESDLEDLSPFFSRSSRGKAYGTVSRPS